MKVLNSKKRFVSEDYSDYVLNAGCSVPHYLIFSNFFHFFLQFTKEKWIWTKQSNHCMCIWRSRLLLKWWYKYVMLSLLFVHFKHSLFLSQISKALCQNILYKICITNTHMPIKYFEYMTKFAQSHDVQIMSILWKMKVNLVISEFPWFIWYFSQAHIDVSTSIAHMYTVLHKCC